MADDRRDDTLPAPIKQAPARTQGTRCDRSRVPLFDVPQAEDDAVEQYPDQGATKILIETPYDDIRFNVVRELQHRAKLPGIGAEQVSVVWATVLLGVHRGGRTKLMALKQISRAIEAEPARAEPLLPVLAVAIRSVRMPEVRTGLSALVSAVEAHPPLSAAVEKHFPELRISAEVAV